jgi:hypothetical protein
LLIPDRKSGLFKRAVSYRRPAEAAVLIRSAVIKLERAKRQLFNLKNRFLSKHKKKIHANYENLLSNAIADGVFRALIMLTLP